MQKIGLVCQRKKSRNAKSTTAAFTRKVSSIKSPTTVAQLKFLKFAKKWAEGITSLLLKDGDEEDPNNYNRFVFNCNVLVTNMLMLAKMHL